MTDLFSRELTARDSIVIVGSTGRMGSMLLREGAAHGLLAVGIGLEESGKHGTVFG